MAEAQALHREPPGAVPAGRPRRRVRNDLLDTGLQLRASLAWGKERRLAP